MLALLYFGELVSNFIYSLALSIYDIDLKNKKMNIHRTLTTDENNAVIMGNKTKTYAGN